MSETDNPTIRLNTERLPGHPWIWSSQVHKPDTRLPPGTVVRVVDASGRFLGHGFWNGHARVALRVLGHRPGRAHRRRLHRRAHRPRRGAAPRGAEAR